MARPTARGKAILAVIVGTYVAARTFGTWELYMLSLAFLGALLVSWLLVWEGGRKLVAWRETEPDQPKARDSLLLSFLVKNGSALPGLQVTLRGATGDLFGGDQDVEFESLGPRGGRVVTLDPQPARRGVHRLPALVAEAEDPLGLMCARRSLGDPLRLTVYPRLVELQSCALFADMGVRRGLRRRGLTTLGGAEFRSIRPHYPGEPLNHVDWKATARTGSLMLREMDDPASGDITVLLDETAAHVVGEPPETSFELAVEAAGAVADFALRAGRGVHLLLRDDRWSQTRLAPNTGGRHRLLEILAEATPRARSQLGTSLPSLIARGRPPMRTRTVTLVVMRVDTVLVRSLFALRESGLRVSVIHVVADSFRAATPTDESRAPLLSLASAGVPCLSLERGDDLRSALSLRREDARRMTVT
jgi:uncharacterized protein (DUF58 family)